MMKVRHLWERFKWLVECPGQEVGRKRVIGLVLYISCLVASVGLVIAMFQGSQSAYVTYTSEGSDDKLTVLHRIPDFVACPKEPLRPKSIFNVAMNPKTVAATGIDHDDIDNLARIQFESCESPEKCDLRQLRTPCEGTKYEKYCKRMDDHFMKDPLFSKFSAEAFTSAVVKARHMDMITPLNQMAAIHFLKEQENGKWTLQMLWVGLISSGYSLIGDVVAKNMEGYKHRSGLNCFFYNVTDIRTKKDRDMMAIQQSITKTIWVGKSLCMAFRGSDLPFARTPYFGCEAFVTKRIKQRATSKDRPIFMPPFRYWIGNLLGKSLTQDSFYLTYMLERYNDNTKKPRTISAVLHYSMFVTNDETIQKRQCSEQPLIKGMETTCQLAETNHSRWQYELFPQARLMEKVWVYGKTKITVNRKLTFTPYTKFQFGAGIFGCLLGMSIAQIMESIMIFSKRWFRTRKGITVIYTSRIILFTFLIIGSIALTVFDMDSYLRGRYSTTFTQRESELEVPIIKLCPGAKFSFGFLNTTKMAELNVSLQLYGYLKFAGMLRTPRTQIISRIKRFNNGTQKKEVPSWMIRNFIPPKKSIETCNGDLALCQNMQWPEFLDHYIPTWNVYRPRLYDKSGEFFRKMKIETSELERKLGLPKKSSVREIILALHLDPRHLFTECRLQNQNIRDCWRYASYTYNGERSVCLSLDIPKTAVQGKHSYGYEKGLFITIHHTPYHRHSDQLAYHGPDVEKDTEVRRIDALCGNGLRIISDESSARGFSPEVCSGGAGWNMNIQLKSFSTTGFAYRLKTEFTPESFAAEIRTGFRFNDLQKNCESNSRKPTCTHPNEELAGVIRAIHYEIQCSCSVCYGSSEEANKKMLTSAEKILDRGTHCCTATEFFACFTKEIEKVDWIALRDKYTATLKNGMTTKKTIGMEKQIKKGSQYAGVASFLFSPVQLSLQYQLKSADEKQVKTLFPVNTLEKLTNETIDRFIEHARSCYQEPCKVDILELMNIQPKQSVENKSSIAIFYNTDVAYGMEIIDMFDPVQLVATLVAGYSATFGISLMGLIELIIIIVRTCTSEEQRSYASSTTRRHILKTFAVFMTPNFGASEQSPPTDVREINEKEVEKSTPKEEKEYRDDSKNKYDSGSSGMESAWVKALLVMLLFLLIASAFFVVYFFCTFSNVVFDGGISEVVSYEEPSIVLCVEKKESVQLAAQALAKGNCITKEGRKMCHKLFNVFFRNREKRFCFMMDNSRKLRNADDTVDDLVMEIPDSFPPVFIGAVSLNRTSLENIYPFTEWADQNAVITYSLTLRESQDSKCVSEIPKTHCKICPAAVQNEGLNTICCSDSGLFEPAITTSQTCSEYNYGAVITSMKKEPLSKTRKLLVKLKEKNMMVYSMKKKYSFVYYVSIVGGFIGSFIEVTVLNVLGAVVLIFLRIVKPTSVKPTLS